MFSSVLLLLVQKGRKGIEAGRQEPGQIFIDVSALFGIFDGMNVDL